MDRGRELMLLQSGLIANVKLHFFLNNVCFLFRSGVVKMPQKQLPTPNKICLEETESADNSPIPPVLQTPAAKRFNLQLQQQQEDAHLKVFDFREMYTLYTAMYGVLTDTIVTLPLHKGKIEKIKICK